MSKVVVFSATTVVVAILLIFFKLINEPIKENITVNSSSSLAYQQQNSNSPEISIEYKRKTNNFDDKHKKSMPMQPIVDNKSLEFIAEYSGKGIEIKNKKVPMKLIIGNKIVNLTLPLAKIKNPKRSFLIIKDKNDNVIAKLNPSFVNYINKNQNVKVDYNPKSNKITSVHINDNVKKVLKSAPQKGDLPNFNFAEN